MVSKYQVPPKHSQKQNSNMTTSQIIDLGASVYLKKKIQVNQWVDGGLQNIQKNGSNQW